MEVEPAPPRDAVSRGLWRGTSPTVARLAIGVGVHFLALEYIKDAIYNFSPQGAEHKHGQLSPIQAFLSGGVSRGIAAAVTCPVTVVKTRMEYVSATSIKYKVNHMSWPTLSLTICHTILSATSPQSKRLSSARMCRGQRMHSEQLQHQRGRLG